jgi:hypothetical protein
MIDEQKKMEQTDNPWQIKKYETAKHDLPLTFGMENEVIPRFPCMQLLCGKSGSGKSNFLLNLMKNKDLMGEFFDEIFLISPTAKADDLVKHLELDEGHVWDDLDKAVGDLAILLDNQAYDIETKGIKETNKILVICDDCVGDKKFMKADPLLKLAIHGRHNLVSSIICTQSYTKCPRAIRLQAQGLAIFNGSSLDEVKLIAEDYCPSGYTKKDFMKIVGFATEKPYDFLWINGHVKDMKQRFRKNLSEIIML